MTLTELKSQWVDTEAYHKHIHELFFDLINQDDQLKAHRDFVEKGWGFGERSFWWLWMLVCSEMPNGFSFLEVGVYKGATLSVIKLLRPDATVHGITPLSTEGNYPESDYRADIKAIHDHFNQEQPNIINGLSNESWVIQSVKDMMKFDVIYIDGDHSYEGCLSDLNNYAPEVKKGGYLAVDDSCCNMHMPWGYFQGHKPVTEALLAYMDDHGSEWEFITNVVHLRLYKKI